MSVEPDNVLLRLMREVRAAQKIDSEKIATIEPRMDEIHETMYPVAGMSAHSNIRHDGVAEELAGIKERLKKLEEKA